MSTDTRTKTAIDKFPSPLNKAAYEYCMAESELSIAMSDGLNVHGAMSRLVAAEETLRREAAATAVLVGEPVAWLTPTYSGVIATKDREHLLKSPSSSFRKMAEGHTVPVFAAPSTALVALKDLLWAAHAKPSCQKGVLDKCMCLGCASDRAREALAAHEGKTS